MRGSFPNIDLDDNRVTPPPRFSIIIPTHGRSKRLPATLSALERLDVDSGAIEVIVIDDGTVPPVAVPKSTLAVRVLRQPRGGPARARNHGAREARGQILIFLDDDCEPDKGWLREISRRLDPGVAVGGSMWNGQPENVFAEASHLVVEEFTRSQRSDSDSPRFLPTANLALYKDSFFAAGGFDERFPAAAGEDREFCARWLSRGFSLELEPAAIVYHSHPMGLMRFLRQHYAYGNGARRFYSGHPSARRTPPAFYSRLFTTLTHRASTKRRVAALVWLSQIVTGVGYITGSRRER